MRGGHSCFSAKRYATLTNSDRLSTVGISKSTFSCVNAWKFNVVVKMITTIAFKMS